MDANSKHIKTGYVLKHSTSASNLRLRLLRVSAGDDEAFKQCRASAVKSTIRKYLRRQQKRAQLVKLAKVLGVVVKREKKQSLYHERPTAACVRHHPPGAMAPENTTQYLMSNVYDDMATHVQPAPVSHTCSHLYGESLSPRSVYTALDSDYESSLAFQQRDFEEVFDLCW